MEIKLKCPDCLTDLTPVEAELEKIVSYRALRALKFTLTLSHKQAGGCLKPIATAIKLVPT